MACATNRASSAYLLLFFLILLLNPLTSYSLPFSHYHTLLSLSHSLTSRVANLRASRGDHAGAARAQVIAEKLKSLTGLGFYRLAWTMGWDYFRNYVWADINTFSFNSLASTLSDLNELLRALNDLTRANSDIERVAWISRNYKKILSVSKSLFGKLLKKFSQQGPLREVVEAIWKELVDGEFLRDCMALGGNDLMGFIQVIREIILQYGGSRGRNAEL